MKKNSEPIDFGRLIAYIEHNTSARLNRIKYLAQALLKNRVYDDTPDSRRNFNNLQDIILIAESVRNDFDRYFLSVEDSERIATNKVMTNIRDLVADVKEISHIQLHTSGGHANLVFGNLCDGLGQEFLLLDRNHFKMVAEACISNAIKYASPPHQVCIQWLFSPAFASFSIRNPITQAQLEDLDRFFEPGWRHISSFDEHLGAGLGLTMAQRVCLANDWEIELQGNTTSEGHCFLTVKVEIPRGAKHAPHSPRR